MNKINKTKTNISFMLSNIWFFRTSFHLRPLLYCHLLDHNDTINKQTHAGITDAMIKMQEDFFNKIFTSHFISRVQKGLLKVCVWEGAGDQT